MELKKVLMKIYKVIKIFILSLCMGMGGTFAYALAFSLWGHLTTNTMIFSFYMGGVMFICALFMFWGYENES